MLAYLTLAIFAAASAPIAQAHVAMFHPSMWGINITSASDPAFDYDNRPVAPLFNMDFQKWWFHNHLDFPPAEGQFFDLPAGGSSTAEVACTKSATSFFDVGKDDGGDIRGQNGASLNDPCPGSPSSEWHTNGINDTTGCALAITYQSDERAVQPEDFTIFSVNHTCVFNRFTEFQVPERMPACPPGGCICAWFWVHSPDSGGEQNYMNGFRCNVTGATSAVPLAQPEVPRRCGRDVVLGSINANGEPDYNHDPVASNCTHGAKQPFYWDNERSNMFEGLMAPPYYNDLYNFADGAQEDIFADSYDFPLPSPSVNGTAVPTFKPQGGGKLSQKIARGSDFASNAQGHSGSNNGTTANGTSSSSAATASATASGTTGGSTTAATATHTSSTLAAQISTSTAVQTIQTTSTKVETSTATATQTVIFFSVVTVTASPSGTPTPSSESTFSVTASDTNDTLPTSIATTLVISSTTEKINTIQTLIPAAAALAEPVSNDEALKLSNFALDPPASGSSTSGEDSGPGASPQACKRGLVDATDSGKLKQKRQALFSFHATNSFKRRKLTDPKRLWSMW